MKLGPQIIVIAEGPSATYFAKFSWLKMSFSTSEIRLCYDHPHVVEKTYSCYLNQTHIEAPGSRNINTVLVLLLNFFIKSRSSFCFPRGQQTENHTTLWYPRYLLGRAGKKALSWSLKRHCDRLKLLGPLYAEQLMNMGGQRFFTMNILPLFKPSFQFATSKVAISSLVILCL